VSMNKQSRNFEFLHGNETLKQQLLSRQLTIAMIIAIVFFPITLLRVLEIGFKPINAAQALLCFALMGAYVYRRALKPRVAAFVVCVVIILWCVAAGLNYGLLAPAHLAVPFVTVFASIAFGHRIALGFFWATIVGISTIGALHLCGALHYQVDVHWYVHSWTSWFILLALQASLALWYLYLVAPINEATRKTSQHLEAVLQGINDALLVHDKDSGAILQVNQKMCAMFGYSPEEALRLSVGDLSAGSPPYGQGEARGWMDRAISEGPQLFEWQAKDRMGRLFWVEVNMRLAHLDGTERLLVLVRDISARRQAECDLRQAQANMSALIESTDDLIWSVDLDTRYLTFNRNAQEHIREAHGMEIRVGVAPDQIMSAERAAFWMSLYARAIEQGPFRQELVLSSGKVHEVALTPIVSGTERAGISVFAKDITDRVRAEQALRESERKTRAIFDLSFGFIGLLTPDGVVLDVNRTALEFAGVTLEDVKGKPFWDTLWWSHSSEAQETIRSAVAFAAKGQLVESESTHIAADGAPRVVEFTLKPVKDDTGQVIALIPEGRDITEGRAAQSQLLASNEKFLKLFHSSPDAILVTHLSDGKIVEVNAAFEKFSGFTRVELLGRPVLELEMYDEADRARFVSTLVQDHTLRDAEFTIKRKSGEELLVLASAELMEVDGEPHAITILHDITERKRAEVALRESEERFNVAFQFMPVGAGITTLDEGRFIAANKHFKEVFGYGESELLGHTTSEFGIWANPEDRAHVVSMIQNGQSVHAFEVPIRRKDGSAGWASYSGVRVVLNGKEYLLSGAVDITAHKRAEQLLRDSEERYKALFERSLDLVYINDFEGRFIDANDAALRRLGYERDDIPSLGFADFLSEDQMQLAFSAMQEIRTTGSQSRLTEFRLRHKDGSDVYVETKGSAIISNGRCVAIQSVARDITERRSLEEQLRQSQKMEAVGSLAGGVAHDFNNLLAVILNHTEFAMEGVPTNGPVMDDLTEIMKASERAAGLTRQLLAFSRKQVLQPQSLNFNDIAAGLEKLLRRILGEDIDYVQVLASDLGQVRADPGQVEQVLMNLAVNARDAMPNGGQLTIETANVDLDEEYAQSYAAVNPGPFVMIAVTDTGIGMDEDTKARIFEPFFTTKEKGRGTGLGLSTVYGIVKQSGGYVWVYSELGRGTTFKIYLPRVFSATEAPAVGLTKAQTSAVGTETILVVEDEEALRGVAIRILGAAGYTVLLAANGQEALQASARHAGPIHLLLTDVVMPGINGRVLAEKLLQTRPQLKVIYMSGYTDDTIVHHGVLDEGTHFINKPIGAADLTRRVREVLDG
jgi:two-component system, cell cycle sensor histidine kinase and response regulator CckA